MSLALPLQRSCPLHPSPSEPLPCAGAELWREEGGAQGGKVPDSLAPAPRGPCLPIFPLCAWPAWWGAEARRALMCCSAWCHSLWAQRAGTSVAWARRLLQSCLWLTSQHGAALFAPGEARTAPSARLLLGYVPNKAYGEQQGLERHLPQEIRPRVTQESRCCPGDGEGVGGTGRPWGWPRRLHNYKASGSCIAEVIQEIGLIGSCQGRQLSRLEAVVPDRQLQCPRSLLRPRHRAGAAAAAA